MKQTQPVEETMKQYVNAWNTPGLENTKAVLANCWAEGATYIDRNTPLVTGIDEIAQLIDTSFTKIPGRSFSIHSQPEYHNNGGRLFWEVLIPGQQPLIGMDFFEYDADNKITRIVGFVPGA